MLECVVLCTVNEAYRTAQCKNMLKLDSDSQTNDNWLCFQNKTHLFVSHDIDMLVLLMPDLV